MQLKYISNFTNVQGDKFTLRILTKDSSVIAPQRINVTCSLQYAGQSDMLKPFKGLGLDINFEANNEMTFQDLYSEEENQFLVELDDDTRNIKLFRGYLKSDGLFQDYVSSRWIVSLNAIDGLSDLEDLRFVDEDGFPFIGLMTEIDIIYNCLLKTKLNLDIHEKIEYQHDQMNSELMSTLANTKLNTERFYKDSESDDAEIMDCEEVLKSILQKYNAVLMQQNGKWWIFQPQYTFDVSASNPNLEFHKFVDGVESGMFTKYAFSNIGSELNGFYPHHANENQRIEISKSTAAFRVKYDYGTARKLIANPEFTYDSNGNIAGWEQKSTASFELCEDDLDNQNGLVWKLQDYPTGFPLGGNLELINGFLVEKNDILSLDLRYIDKGKVKGLVLRFKLQTDNEIYFFNNTESSMSDHAWKLGSELTPGNDFGKFILGRGGPAVDYVDGSIYRRNGDDYSLSLVIPEDGDFSVEVFAPETSDPSSWITPISELDYGRLEKLSATPDDELKSKESEVHTSYRERAKTTNVPKPLEVYNNNMDSDIYVGAIKSQNNVNTLFWFRKEHPNEEKNLIRIMVEDRIRFAPKPQKVFSGDVFGYFNPLSVLKIDRFNGKFLINSYIYNVNKNIISMQANQFFDDDMSSTDRPDFEADIFYERSFERGETVKPTISG